MGNFDLCRYSLKDNILTFSSGICNPLILNLNFNIKGYSNPPGIIPYRTL